MRRSDRFALALTLAALSAIIFDAAPARAIGYLVPTRPDVEPLAIRYHRVQVGVRERIAETRVEQTFVNHTGEVLEATYIFPVPDGATVSGFALWVNGRRQEGELLDAGHARAIYEQIVARMQDPGLVEHMGGNLFRARVFPIQPGSEQRLEIRFTQTLDYQGGIVHYRYPLHTSGRAAQTLQDFTLSADIVSRTPIRAVYSPSHAISVARQGEHRATVGFEANRAVLEQDFELYYGVQDRDVGLSLLTHRPTGEDGYFLAMIAPRAEVAEREIAAKEVIFVFDTSGSMAGEKMRRAQSALDYMLSRLNPSDRFQLVRFSTDVEAFFDERASVPASPGNIARARSFAGHMVPAGGTAIHPALEEALRTPRPRETMPRIVVFLTDGMPTVGEVNTDRITSDVAQWSTGARVYVFGVGDDVNTTFLDSIAERTGGVGDYFRDGAELERRLSAFYDRIAYPLFTDLRLEFPGLSVYDVYPRDLGHLYRGGQLLVVGRYRGEGASQITLEGRIADETDRRSFAYPVAFPAHETRNEFLPRIWATRKIGYLLDTIRMNGERPELRTEVVELARRFGIVTPYTSFLVVEEQALPPELGQVRPGQHSLQGDEDRRFSLERRGPIDPTQVPPNVLAPNVLAPPAPPPSVDRAEEAAEDFQAFDFAIQSPTPRVQAQQAAPQPGGGQGESGRRLSARLRSMREAERTENAPTASRVVMGRSFRFVNGRWVDER
jgi:Ca-activated chloride channel homolog